MARIRRITEVTHAIALLSTFVIGVTALFAAPFFITGAVLFFAIVSTTF